MNEAQYITKVKSLLVEEVNRANSKVKRAQRNHYLIPNQSRLSLVQYNLRTLRTQIVIVESVITVAVKDKIEKRILLRSLAPYQSTFPLAYQFISRYYIIV